MYGHENDDVIWRIEVRNNGLADLQDLAFSDTMQPGNFEIDYICDTEGDATSAATGGGTGNCQAVAGVTQLLDVTLPSFSAAARRRTSLRRPAAAASTISSAASPTPARIAATRSSTSSGAARSRRRRAASPRPRPDSTAQDDALLSTLAVANTLDVDVDLTGTNTAQPMGSKGTVTIRISNNTGGTIKGGIDGIELRNVLPAEYVIDTTFDPTVSMAPAYGNSYPGMLDTIRVDQPAAEHLPADARTTRRCRSATPRSNSR